MDKALTAERKGMGWGLRCTDVVNSLMAAESIIYLAAKAPSIILLPFFQNKIWLCIKKTNKEFSPAH